MSNKEQIKHKQKLQAQFQLNFSSLNSKVLSWIPDDSTKSNNNDDGKSRQQEETKSQTESFGKELDQFLNLAVIKQGSGLSLGSSESENQGNSSTTTIGDFINSGKISNSKDKDRDNRRAGLGKIAVSKGKVEKGSIQGNSKALNSLRNKIRDDKRKSSSNNNKFSNRGSTFGSKPNLIESKNNNSDSDSDSDDDDEVLKRKSSAKNGNNSKNLKSKRPF